MDETYYTIDSRKLGYGEYWRMSNKRLLPFTVAALRKLFGLRMNMKVAIPRITRVMPQEPADVPAPLREKLTTLVNEAVAEKLELCFFYTVPTLTLALSSAAVLLNSDGLIVAQAMVIYSLRTRKTTAVFSCVSKLRDTRLLSTSSSSEKFDHTRAGYLLPEYLPGATVFEVCARHRARLAGAPALNPERIDRKQLESFIVEISQRNFDVKAASGLYVPMLPAEVDRMRAERQKALNSQSI